MNRAWETIDGSRAMDTDMTQVYHTNALGTANSGDISESTTHSSYVN